VANWAALNALAGNVLGDVRLIMDTNRAFAWNGAAWIALAADQNGDFTLPGKIVSSMWQPSTTAVEGTSDANCVVADPTTWGRTVKNATGLLLSCQSGTWRSL
jgi:hypothetical protein